MKKRNIYYKFIRVILRLILKLFLNIKVVDKIKPEKNKNYVFIANHSNWIDPVLMFTFLPKNNKLTILSEAHSSHSKDAILKLLKLCDINIIEFDRSNPTARISALKKASKVVAQGQSLLIFPEGRICRVDDEFYPFFKGSFFIAKAGKSTILPVYIRGSEQVYFRRKISIAYGNPITTTKKTNVRKLTLDTYNYMKNELAPKKPHNNAKNKLLDITNLFLATPPPIEPELFNIPLADGKTSLEHYKNAKDANIKNTARSNYHD